MQEEDGVLAQLPSLLKESAKAAVSENASVLGAVQAKLVARTRDRSRRRWLTLVIPAAVIVALFGGVLAAAGVAGEAPVQFVLKLMPNRAPDIAPPGAVGQIPCNAPPDETIAISAARPGLRFGPFSLAHDPAAKLLQSKLVYGCDGAKSLDLIYDVNGSAIEVTQGTAPSAAGPLYLNLKAADNTKTPAQLGWTTEQIGGHEVAIHTGKAGKGYAGGIDTVMWQTRGTLIVVTSHSPALGLARQELDEIVVNMLPA